MHFLRIRFVLFRLLWCCFGIHLNTNHSSERVLHKLSVKHSKVYTFSVFLNWQFQITLSQNVIYDMMPVCFLCILLSILPTAAIVDVHPFLILFMWMSLRNMYTEIQTVFYGNIISVLSSNQEMKQQCDYVIHTIDTEKWKWRRERESSIYVWNVNASNGSILNNI